MTNATSQPGSSQPGSSQPGSSQPGSSQPGAVFIGIDVAKDSLDLARSDSKGLLRLANDQKGIGRIIASLPRPAVACIVIEATGGLEQPLLDALLDAQLPVARVNPGHVRHFAKGLGILAKTDRIDARVLAAFARLASPRLAAKRSAHQVELEALVTCRRQLILVRTEQTNRRGVTRSKAARKAIDAVLKVLEKQVADLDQQIAQLIDSDDDFHSIDKLLQSVPGVGPTLSATLLAELDELGKIDRKRLGALAGVVPYNHDSGRLRGTRSIAGGRTSVRCPLYMATVAAMRFNPVIKAFAQRLKAKGKRSKVVIVACMSKLLAFLNAMRRDNLTWDQLKVVKNFRLSH
jgi:transposase